MALDVALCYGCIDGQRDSFDENYYLQKYTLCRPKSNWSQINVEKVERLIASGEMKSPGQPAFFILRYFSHQPINSDIAKLGVASPCLPVFHVTIKPRLARVMPTYNRRNLSLT